MKKLFLICTLILSTVLFAAEPAGVISLTTKPIIISTLDEKVREAKTGDQFFPGETLITPEGGKTQLLFRDQMTINLGQNSELKVDDFIFNKDDTAKNTIATSIKKGAFKFISGKIATDDQKAMKVKTPKTQIAIRGTSVLGNIEPAAENIVLLDGVIDIAPIDNPVLTQTINQSGYGVSVDSQSGSVSAPKEVDSASLSTIFKEVSLTSNNSDSNNSTKEEKTTSSDTESKEKTKTSSSSSSAETKTTSSNASKEETKTTSSAITTNSSNNSTTSTSKTTTSSASSFVESRQSQQLVSAIAKSMLQDDNSELNKTFGKRAEEVKTAFIKATNSVINSKEKSTAADKTNSTSPSASTSTVNTNSRATSPDKGDLVIPVTLISSSTNGSTNAAVTVAEIFTAIVSQNAEASSIVIEAAGSTLTNTSTGSAVNYETAISSNTTSGSTFADLTTGRSGTITYSFNSLSFTATSGTGSGSGTAAVYVNIDDQQFTTTTSGSGNLGGTDFTWTDVGSGARYVFGDGDSIKNDGSAYLISNDTISNLNFSFESTPTKDSSGNYIGTADFLIKFTADKYNGVSKDYAKAIVEITDHSNTISATQEITPNK